MGRRVPNHLATRRQPPDRSLRDAAAVVAEGGSFRLVLHFPEGDGQLSFDGPGPDWPDAGTLTLIAPAIGGRPVEPTAGLPVATNRVVEWRVDDSAQLARTFDQLAARADGDEPAAVAFLVQQVQLVARERFEFDTRYRAKLTPYARLTLDFNAGSAALDQPTSPPPALQSRLWDLAHEDFT